MEGRLFTLVNAADESQVFAWGMEISTDVEREAVIYNRDPETGQTFFGVHRSAESACHRYDSEDEPIRVVWEDEY